LGGSFEEIHDLDQLVLGLIDPGDVVEGDLRILLLVVATRLALADAHEPGPHAPALPCAPEHPDVKADDEQGRAKPEEERRPRAAAFLDRLGADLDPMIDQESFQTGAHEGGEMVVKELTALGGPGGVAPPLLVGRGLAFGRGTLFAGRRVGDRCLEAARDGVAPTVNCLDVALPDFLLEQGIGHGDRTFRARHQQPHQEEVHDQGDHEP
jgi:hypothetical protein